MQNQSIFVSSNTQLVTSLNIAQKQLHYEVPATRNTRSPPTLTSHVKADMASLAFSYAISDSSYIT
ncbi:hypothetical protein DPMN_097753 [Dreissena polymorpha]|uniref:Uncharacterized protein n=1 Tax=Dreissena polymorpha TaxID=45954 RepID=A0A9D4LCA8_DREPO|nr:hypothetical protein DPMN_097753 [Dreissena polymorpha]